MEYLNIWFLLKCLFFLNYYVQRSHRALFEIVIALDLFISIDLGFMSTMHVCTYGIHFYNNISNVYF
jgi:hypothetical protein